MIMYKYNVYILYLCHDVYYGTLIYLYGNVEWKIQSSEMI